jgi:hypothetical protein
LLTINRQIAAFDPYMDQRRQFAGTSFFPSFWLWIPSLAVAGTLRSMEQGRFFDGSLGPFVLAPHISVLAHTASGLLTHCMNKR